MWEEPVLTQDSDIILVLIQSLTLFYSRNSREQVSLVCILLKKMNNIILMLCNHITLSSSFVKSFLHTGQLGSFPILSSQIRITKQFLQNWKKLPQNIHLLLHWFVTHPKIKTTLILQGQQKFHSVVQSTHACAMLIIFLSNFRNLPEVLSAIKDVQF